MNGQAGKGDAPRPMFITAEEYAANWERAFGKKQVKAEEAKEEEKQEQTS